MIENHYVLDNKNFTKYFSFSLEWLVKIVLFLIQLFGFEFAFIIEDGINNPSTLPKEKEAKMCKYNSLVFKKTISPLHTLHDTSLFQKRSIKTADKYIVDSLHNKIKTFEEYLKSNIKTKKHRDTIKRFGNKLKENKGVIEKLVFTDNEDDVKQVFDQLQPLFAETQSRNKGNKTNQFLFELLKACFIHGDEFVCYVVKNKEEEIVAFAIYMIIAEEHMVFVPAIGNCYEKGKIYYAYHNLLTNAIKFSIEHNCDLDFGYSHYQIKRVFEPTIVPHYIEYRGNNFLIALVIQLYILFKETCFDNKKKEKEKGEEEEEKEKEDLK